MLQNSTLQLLNTIPADPMFLCIAYHFHFLQRSTHLVIRHYTSIYSSTIRCTGGAVVRACDWQSQVREFKPTGPKESVCALE